VHRSVQGRIFAGGGRAFAFAALLAPLVAGCGSQSPDQPFQEYLTRLGRTLSVERGAVEKTPLPQLPRPGALRLDLASGSLDGLDFLALSGCALQVTIGKRNSSLGRMAPPSQRLLLELEFLQLAPACIQHLRDKGREELAATVQEAANLKKEQLPALIFNATLASEEYRDFWRGGSLPPEYPEATGSAVVSALRAVTAHSRRWLAGDYTADNLGFELLLGEIARGDGGELLRALAHQKSWLEAANRMLEQRAARGPLCTQHIRPAAADILPNVVHRFFIDGIQPRAAAVGRRYHELLPAVAELEALLADALPAPYRGWQQRRDALLATFVTAPREHVRQLQAVQEPCSSPAVQGQAALAGAAPGMPK
jgi:hypothetical protein